MKKYGLPPPTERKTLNLNLLNLKIKDDESRRNIKRINTSYITNK